MGGMPMGAMPMPYEQQQPKKAPVGLIVGGILAVVALAGGAFMLGRGGDDDVKKDAVAVNDTAKTAAPEEPKKDSADEKPAEASADAAKAEDAKAEDGKAEDGKAEDAKAEDGKAEKAGSGDAKAEDAKAEEGKAEKAGSDDTVGPGGKDGNDNGLDVLGRDCSKSDLAPHDGFQESPACVSTQMGEVAAEDELPSLLITAAPETVEVGKAFELKVSTRNLVRDRFLGAADGGYYLESSFLDDNGLQRGHFHTACRILPSTDEAPDSGGTPEFFLATQDNKGGAEPDTVTIEVPGIDEAGELQCTSWAGDGSHRTPMMTKADETPAVDSVRITVTG